MLRQAAFASLSRQEKMRKSCKVQKIACVCGERNGMSRLVPDTRNSLLLRLRDPHDAAAWDEFVSIYRPVIVRLAYSRGLQEADAEDLAQQVLVSISKKISEWQVDPNRARFRTWLNQVTRNAAVNAVTRRRADRGIGGTSAMVLINGKAANDCSDEEVFDLESRRQLFRRAADDLRDEFQLATWNAFWLTAIEGLSAAKVAEETGKSVGAVYVARCRVMARLQEKVRHLSAASGEGS